MFTDIDREQTERDDVNNAKRLKLNSQTQTNAQTPEPDTHTNSNSNLNTTLTQTNSNSNLNLNTNLNTKCSKQWVPSFKAATPQMQYYQQHKILRSLLDGELNPARAWAVASTSSIQTDKTLCWFSIKHENFLLQHHTIPFYTTVPDQQTQKHQQLKLKLLPCVQEDNCVAVTYPLRRDELLRTKLKLSTDDKPPPLRAIVTPDELIVYKRTGDNGYLAKLERRPCILCMRKKVQTCAWKIKLGGKMRYKQLYYNTVGQANGYKSSLSLPTEDAKESELVVAPVAGLHLDMLEWNVTAAGELFVDQQLMYHETSNDQYFV